MITVKKIGKHLGAEISGVDLSRPLDDDTFAQVANAFFDNEVVFFRNQKLTLEQHIAFTKRFGELEQHVRKEARLADHPEISYDIGETGSTSCTGLNVLERV